MSEAIEDPQAQILAEVDRVEAEAAAAVKPPCMACGKEFDGDPCYIPGTSPHQGIWGCQQCADLARTTGETAPPNTWHGMNLDARVGAMPLAYVCEIMAMLVANGVESYEDGPIRIRRNPDLMPAPRQVKKSEPRF